MNFEIATYWNVETLYYVLNGVASIMSGAGFSGALRMVFYFALAYGIFLYSGNQQLGLVKWFIHALVFTTVLNLPIATVTIKDRSSLEPPRVVAHVPFMLAAVAQASNAISGWATQSYETVFGVPDELGLQQGDVAFGHRILKNVNRIVIRDSALRADLMQFIKECTLYDIRDGEITPKALISETDSWNTIFKKTSPARFVTYNTLTASPTTDTCTAAGLVLQERVESGIAAAQSFYGRLNFSRATTDELGGTLFASAVGSSYDWILGSSATASDAMRQAMFNNIWREAGSQLPALLGDSARIQELQTLAAEAQAARQADGSNATLASMAQETIPHMRNWLEAIIYSLFPLIVILMVLVSPESAKKMIAGYMMALVWIGIQPVMFAVINHLSLLHLRHKLAALQLASGVPFQLSDVFDATLANEQAAIGYMLVLVPFLSAAVVKLAQGGFMSVADRMMTSFTSAGSAAGGNSASGNVNMGQAGIDTAAVNTTSMSKYDSNIGLSGGGAKVGLADGGTATVAPNGTIALQQMRNSLLEQISVDSRVQSDSSMERHSSDIANSGELSTSVNGSTATLSNSIGRHSERGASQHTATSTSDTASAGHQGTHTGREALTKSGADQASFDAAIGAQIEMGAAANAGIGVSAGLGGARGAQAQNAGGSTSASNSQGERRIRHAMKEGGGTEAEQTQALSNLREATIVDDFGNQISRPGGADTLPAAGKPVNGKAASGGNTGRIGFNLGAQLSGSMAKTYSASQGKSNVLTVAHSSDESAERSLTYSDTEQRSLSSGTSDQSSQGTRISADAQFARSSSFQQTRDEALRSESGVGNRVSRNQSDSATVHQDLTARPDYLANVAAANGMTTYRFAALPQARQMQLMSEFSNSNRVFQAARSMPNKALDGQELKGSKSELVADYSRTIGNAERQVSTRHLEDIKSVGPGAVSPVRVDNAEPPTVEETRKLVDRQLSTEAPDSIPARAAALDEKIGSRAAGDKKLGAGPINVSAYAEGAVAADLKDSVLKLVDKAQGGDGTSDGTKITNNMRTETQIVPPINPRGHDSNAAGRKNRQATQPEVNGPAYEAGENASTPQNEPTARHGK